MEFNVNEVLGYGAVGLGFLLAVLTAGLLRTEQKRQDPRPVMLRAFYAFMIFSLALMFVGLASDYSQSPAKSKATELETELRTCKGTLGDVQEQLDTKETDLSEATTQLAEARAVTTALLNQKEGKIQKLRDLQPDDPEWRRTVEEIASDLRSLDRELRSAIE